MRCHSCLSRSAAFAAFACLACANTAHAQVTLGFENLPDVQNGAVNSHSVTQNGFTVAAVEPSNVGNLNSLPPTPGGVSNYTGSVALYNNVGGAGTTLAQNNGRAFTLVSIDIADLVLRSSGISPASVTFNGAVQGGGTVVQSFTRGVNDSLETVTFGSNFTSLLSVSFSQGGIFYQFDNIRVTPVAVPEPGSFAVLCGQGVSGAGLLVRRRSV